VRDMMQTMEKQIMVAGSGNARRHDDGLGG
jgi:hypothetical protein